MTELNCWEIKKCGREPDGLHAEELGICPASVETKLNGINHGKNAGRSCWALTGTLCGGIVQGSFATKLNNCMQCNHYKDVLFDEGKNFKKSTEILNLLKSI